MPAVTDFSTVSELFDGLSKRYEGLNRVLLRHRDSQSKTWNEITWEAYSDDVHAMAGYLFANGIRPGERVAILSENRPEWAVIDMATQILGGINVSLYTSLPSDQVAYIIQDSQSKIFFVSTRIQEKKALAIFDDCPDLKLVVSMSEPRDGQPGYLNPYRLALSEGKKFYAAHKEEIDGLTRSVSPDHISALIYTSGTTGHPKGVMLTHHNFCENVKSALERVPFGEDDEHISFLPLCHSFERMAGYTAVLAYGGIISYAQSTDTVARDLVEVKPTVLISVPRLFEKMYNAFTKSVEQGPVSKKKIFYWAVRSGKKYTDLTRVGRNPGLIRKAMYGVATHLVFSKLHEKLGGRVRFAFSGGAALPADIGEFFMASGVTIVEAYGLTETAPGLTINPFDRPRFGTVGHVINGVTVGIKDLTTGEMLGQISGEDYPNNLSTEAGEIVAKGPNIMLGYWNNEAATRESIDEDGWYHTGDVGRFDAGYLQITDRIKHMIVSAGGKNIYPGPIEDSLKSEPLIDQILVVGEGREYLTALVVPDEDVIERLAKEKGLVGKNYLELLNQAEIVGAMKELFQAYSKSSAAHEKIRDFRFVPEPFTVENGMMTPSLKLKRREIEKNYAVLIDEMYEGVV